MTIIGTAGGSSVTMSYNTVPANTGTSSIKWVKAFVILINAGLRLTIMKYKYLNWGWAQGLTASIVTTFVSGT